MGLGAINLNLQSKTEKLAGYYVGCQKKMPRSNQTRPGRGIPVISPENSYTVNLTYRGIQAFVTRGQVGFAHAESLIWVFQKAEGISPMAYRGKHHDVKPYIFLNFVSGGSYGNDFKRTYRIKSIANFLIKDV